MAWRTSPPLDQDSSFDSGLTALQGLPTIPQTVISLCVDPKLRRYPQHRRSIKEHLPWWDLVETDHQQGQGLVEQHFPQYLDFYQGLLYPEQQANLLRYMCLHLYGGLSLDSEVALVRAPEEELLRQELLLVPTRWDLGFYSTCFMGSRPEHPLWLAVLEESRRRCKTTLPWKLSRQAWVSYTTGSHLLTSVVKSSSSSALVLSRQACLGPEGMLYRLEDRCWDTLYGLLMLVLAVIVVVLGLLWVWVIFAGPAKSCGDASPSFTREHEKEKPASPKRC